MAVDGGVQVGNNCDPSEAIKIEKMKWNPQEPFLGRTKRRKEYKIESEMENPKWSKLSQTCLNFSGNDSLKRHQQYLGEIKSS
jgi:hypothetical protein